MQTVYIQPQNNQHKLTVSVFERLLLFGGLGDDFDPLAEEDTNVSAVAIEHLDGQHEVLSLVGVGYVQGFGCAIVLMIRRKWEYQIRFLFFFFFQKIIIQSVFPKKQQTKSIYSNSSIFNNFKELFILEYNFGNDLEIPQEAYIKRYKVCIYGR